MHWFIYREFMRPGRPSGAAGRSATGGFTRPSAAARARFARIRRRTCRPSGPENKEY